MQIKVNGKEHSVDAKTSLQTLIQTLGLEGPGLIVEHNGEFLESDSYTTILLKDGDVLELVRFVGGG